MAKPFFKKSASLSSHKPLVIAHRGASGLAPENTVAAFKLAMAMRAEGVELDVHLAADGKPVVIHDRRVNRTTDATGRVTAFTAEQLSQFDAGSWFLRKLSRRPRALRMLEKAATEFGEAAGLLYGGALDFSREAVPSLEEIFTLLTPAKPRHIYVELKGESAKKVALLEATLALVRSHRLEHQVTLLSFDHEIIRQAKDLAPAVRTALTFPATRNALARSRSIIKSVEQAKADEAALHFGLATRRLVAALHDEGIAVSVWTVNSKIVMRKIIQSGVDAIMTNFPNRLLDVFEAGDVKISSRW